MSRPTFYLIDGHAHIYRSYFAPFRDLTSPTGEPTKATYVFTQMLLNLVQTKKPDYLAMVIDSGDETVFRKEIDPNYKANRPPRPSDFGPQETRILQIVKDAGVPIYVAPGFEADDLLATYARQLEGDFDVFLVSKDKDLRQVLSAHVSMYDPVADIVFTPEAMKEKLGYGPGDAIAVQTLIGDSTDNVPGAAGVGEKTAAQLISDFGSIEGIYANLDKLKSKKKLVENLLAHQPNLPITRSLVTLKTDVPVVLDVPACKSKSLDTPALRQALKELGFRQLLARLGPVESPKPAAAKPSNEPPGLFDLPAAENATKADDSAACDYRLIDTIELFDAFVVELTNIGRFAFDTETTSIHPTQADLVGLSFSWKHGTGCYIPLRAPLGQKSLNEKVVLDRLGPILQSPLVQKIGHNIKYDMLVMRRAGVIMQGIAGDTMLAAFLLDSSRMSFGIDSLALQLLGFRKIPTSDLIGSGKGLMTMDRVDTQRISRYASEDVDITWRLDELLLPRLAAIPELLKLYDEVEVPLIQVLAEMEHNGVRVDPAVLREQSSVLGGRIELLKEQIAKEADSDFNPDSPKQLAEILFTKLKLTPVKKTKTGYSTDVEVLEKLAMEHPVPKLILEYRSLVKLKNTYLDNLVHDIHPQTGRIHTSFNQTGAATGRLSSSDPNLQNIPIRTDEGQRIRLAFVPRDATHVLLSADYSQIELRVLAHFTHEPALLKAFEDDLDIHTAVAAEVFGVALENVSREQRTSAKTINFGIIYGVTAFGLARRIDGLSNSAAQDLIDRYNARFPGIKTFMDECVAHARTNGFVSTILGRRRIIADIDSRIINMRNQAERVSINSVVQGSAADLIKVAMIRLLARLKHENLPGKLLLQVHDELVMEVPTGRLEEHAKVLREEMINAMKMDVPIKVEVGSGMNWKDAK